MEQIKSKVTVVTVTYNAEKYLEQTIKSVIEQDYPNIEYIIIDGASTDGTINVIKKYEKFIHYWLSEPDNGIYDAMNKGTDIATGDWINFLNAGDIYSTNNILKIVNQASENLIGAIYGGVNFWYPEDNKKIYDAPRLPETIKKKLPCCHQSLFIRTELMKQFPYNTIYKISSDVELFFNLYNSGVKFSIINKPFVNFLMGGLSQQNRIKSHLEVLNIVANKSQESTDIYQNASYFVLQNQNPLKNKEVNFLFSLQFNKILKQLEELKENNYIAIYGYGNFGKYLQYYFGNKVIMIVDRCYDEINSFEPKLLNNCPFEVIIISVLGREKEIREYLEKELQITSSKIVEIVC